MTEEEFKNSLWVLLAINDQKAISQICEYDEEKTIACFEEFKNIIDKQGPLEELEKFIDRLYNDSTTRFKHYIGDNDVKIYTMKKSI